MVTSDEYLHDIAFDGKLVTKSGITFDFIIIWYDFIYFSIFCFAVLCSVVLRLTADLADRYR